MKQLLDTVWQRCGTSWIWDENARNQVCTAGEVWSLRQFLQGAACWPNDLPSNNNQTLVVGGLDASLDLLAPDQAEIWLSETIKPVILSFQANYEDQAALIFWLPQGNVRLRTNPATDSVTWVCEAPHRGALVEFGRILWGEPNEYPQEILCRSKIVSTGLFHRRIT